MKRRPNVNFILRRAMNNSAHLGGQPRRNADISKAKRMLGYSPKVSLEEGLGETIIWYKQKNNIGEIKS